MKLAIVTTHPIQYNAPWFGLLAEQPGVNIMVFYTWEQVNVNTKFDPGFGRIISWDIPLLDGYDYTFVKNTAIFPGSHHYKGIVNPTLNKEIEEWGAEAVLIFGWSFKSHLKCMRYFKGKIPILFRGDSTLLDEHKGIRMLLRRLYLRYIYSFVDFALYVGTNNMEYFLAHGLKERQLIFVPHAVDNSRFIRNDEICKDLELMKKSLGIHPNDFVILFAGKFSQKKNPMFILELAKKLSSDRIKFLLVGNGELEKFLKDRTKDKRIKYMDFQNQSKMPLVYHLAEIFVLPSVGPGETWGLAINEAIAAGNFIITTSKTGCATDMVKNWKNGIIVEPHDYTSAARFVEMIINNYPLMSSNKNEINKMILQKHSFDNIVYSVLTLLNRLKSC